MNFLGLQPIFRLFARVYYQMAMRQIDPLHPDVPHIVRRLRELEHG
jgi:hypothetical protein